jgi:hypothetical protein
LTPWSRKSRPPNKNSGWCIKKGRSRQSSRDPFVQLVFRLGSASLTEVVIFFGLALATLFLGILLTGLLAALLAALTGLAALLAGLTGLSRLSALATLLFVFLHIVCHE